MNRGGGVEYKIFNGSVSISQLILPKQQRLPVVKYSIQWIYITRSIQNEALTACGGENSRKCQSQIKTCSIYASTCLNGLIKPTNQISITLGLTLITSLFYINISDIEVYPNSLNLFCGFVPCVDSIQTYFTLNSPHQSVTISVRQFNQSRILTIGTISHLSQKINTRISYAQPGYLFLRSENSNQ